MRIGIVGAGQLGMMLGEAGAKLGLECVFLDPAESPPAARVGRHIRAAYDDEKALAELADTCDVLTFEFENVPVNALGAIEGIEVFPPPAALAAAQDRLQEKQLFEHLGIPLPGYRPVDGIEDLRAAMDRLGTPLVLKTRRFGYDGKGQLVVRGRPQEALSELGGTGLIAEAFVDFDCEVSAIATRSRDGEIVHYPLTRNSHADGILDTSIAPAGDDALAALARDYAARLLEHTGYVGTLALELFACGGQLLANEFAPRVHNSGHWTIEGCHASQFENHLRAVAGLPLAAPGCGAHAGMKNIIGKMPDRLDLPPGAVLHDYGKSARPGRKLAHVTVTADTAAARDAALARLGKFVTH